MGQNRGSRGSRGSQESHGSRGGKGSRGSHRGRGDHNYDYESRNEDYNEGCSKIIMKL